MSVVNQPVNIPADLQRRGTTTATLTIPSRQSHRRTLKDYFVKAGASSFSDIKLGAIVWNRIFDNLAQAVFVSDITERYLDMGFLGYLKMKIPDMDFPTITQDESLAIERNAAPTRMDAYFEDTQEGDVVGREVPGGSLSKKQLMIINLSNGSASSATGNLNLDKMDMPTGLPPFTEGVDVTTAGRRMSSAEKFTLYCIAANVPLNTGSRVTRIHILDGTIELFTSENQEGLLADITNGQELGFDLSPPKVFTLKTPYEFRPAHIFSFKADMIGDGVNALAIGSQQLFLIGIREFLG